ncbi:hypothetical protein SAMN05444358_102139 [Ruegeria halocynthiae]|uniref:Sulfotransferase family protein n=2 Tax=Ruegeria halocynthiae TaxID=985054 RepID=A0A1H2Y205_9RHOB|nr:hypothetical protein SAMN05444358_102139 [Ruegeria halocynthiae]
MSRNFIILFHAREGSTAIVDALSRHKDISVPILEELDRFWINKFYKSNPDFNLLNTMDKIFSSNTFDLGDDWGFQNYISSNKRGQPVESIGFKWRPHGPIKDIAKIFKKNNVQVFILARRDFLELVASLAISKTAKKGAAGHGHAQFDYANMSEQEQASYRKNLETTMHRVSLASILGIMFRRIAVAIRFRLFALRLTFLGVDIKYLFYEDFRDEPEDFLNDICSYGLLLQKNLDSLTDGQIIKKASQVPARDRIIDYDRTCSFFVVRILRKIYSYLVIEKVNKGS